MPRAARRRLIVAAVAAIVLLFVVWLGWLGWIGYFHHNAPADAKLICDASAAALKPIIDARKRHEVDDATFRAAMVRAKELQPRLTALVDLAERRREHPYSIAAAYRYYAVRGPTMTALARLQNFRDALPATTRATP